MRASVDQPLARHTRTTNGTSNNAVVLVESDHVLPLVHVGIVLRTGSVLDPRGLEGLTRMTARMLRMGTRKLDAQQVEERIDSLGAQLHVGCAPSYVQMSGVVVAHNLEPFVQLLSELVTAPTFRNRDLARAKRETVAELVGVVDDDRSLAGRHFRSFALGKHPYARPVVGTTTSVRAITRDAVLNQYKKHFVSGNVIVSMAGAVQPERARELVDRYLTLPNGRAPKIDTPATTLAKGRRLVIVDKPERTQTQIIVGTLGTHVHDADHTALQVANVIFGGLFTARLTHEVRSVRGLSYGASSSLGHDRQRELWTMWTFPAAKDAYKCLSLQLDLYEKWVQDGVKPSELARAKNFLVKSHAFELDTAQKRLDQRIEAELFGLPMDYFEGFVKRVQRVTRADANAALKKRLSRRDLAMAVVATAKELRPELEQLPRLDEVKVVPFDKV
ncbi:MAG: pitrilysin family protein [Polyangiales bacterium]